MRIVTPVALKLYILISRDTRHSGARKNSQRTQAGSGPAFSNCRVCRSFSDLLGPGADVTII